VKISLSKLFKITGQILLNAISGTGEGDSHTANVGGEVPPLKLKTLH
jgi:hypothetical protein